MLLHPENDIANTDNTQISNALHHRFAFEENDDEQRIRAAQALDASYTWRLLDKNNQHVDILLFCQSSHSTFPHQYVQANDPSPTVSSSELICKQPSLIPKT